MNHQIDGKNEWLLLSVIFTAKLGSFIKRQTSGTSSDNEWQRMATIGATSDNEWQRVTSYDNEWQRVTTSGTTSDKEWKWVTKSDNEWQWVTASESSGRAIENGTFSYALFMSWINETSETTRNHYRASHRRESIKTKQEKKLLKIISGYILFTASSFLIVIIISFEHGRCRKWNPFRRLTSITSRSPHTLCKWKKRALVKSSKNNLIYKHA